MAGYRGYRYTGMCFPPTKDPYRKIFTKKVWIWIGAILVAGWIIGALQEISRL